MAGPLRAAGAVVQVPPRPDASTIDAASIDRPKETDEAATIHRSQSVPMRRPWRSNAPIMLRSDGLIRPMRLGNMCRHGIRRLFVNCRHCGHETTANPMPGQMTFGALLRPTHAVRPVRSSRRHTSGRNGRTICLSANGTARLIHRVIELAADAPRTRKSRRRSRNPRWTKAIVIPAVRRDIEALIELLKPEDRLSLRNITQTELIRRHHGYGAWLRNQFRHNKRPDLFEFCYAKDHTSIPHFRQYGGSGNSRDLGHLRSSHVR
jgi:hypothetical protein